MYLWSLWGDVDNATSILSLDHTFCYYLTDIDHCLHIHSKWSATKAWKSTWRRFSSSHNSLLFFFRHPAFHHDKSPIPTAFYTMGTGPFSPRIQQMQHADDDWHLFSTKIYTVWCYNSISFHSFVAYSLCTRTGDNKIPVICCFIDCASLHNIVNKANLVHLFLSMFISFSTCFRQLCAHHQEK